MTDPQINDTRKAELLSTEVEHVDIRAFDARPIVEAMGKMSFTSRDLARATGIYNQMLEDPDCTVFLVIATSVTVADNGLAYTSVAEAAGPFWSGRALGAQNTGQFIAASAVGPGVGALVGAVGFAASFSIVGVLPLLALPLVPRRDRSHD